MRYFELEISVGGIFIPASNEENEVILKDPKTVKRLERGEYVDAIMNGQEVRLRYTLWENSDAVH